MIKKHWSNLLLLLLLLNCCKNSHVKFDHSSKTSEQNIDSVFIEPEKYPNFVGGPTALLEFLNKNLNKSIVADSILREGRVVISFMVDTVGNVINFKIEKSYNTDVDNEFLRALKLMPNWIPGEICLNNMKGPWKRISYRYTLPLKIPYQPMH
jgi:TonB family protein